MRYGNPSIKTGMENLKQLGVTDVLIIPLYPQFAMATTETILVLAEENDKIFKLNKIYLHPSDLMGTQVYDFKGKN